MWLLVPYVLIIAMVAESSSRLEPGAGPLVLWLCAVVVRAAVNQATRPGFLGSLAAAAAMCVITIHTYGYHFRGIEELPVYRVLALNAAGCGAFALSWLGPSRRGVARCVLLLALAPAVVGAAMLLGAARAFFVGDFWTGWKDPNAGPRDVIHPMLRWEAARLGAHLFVPAAAVIAAARIVCTVSSRNQDQ